MLIHKLKLVALTVLFLGAVATGAGSWPFAGDEGRAQQDTGAVRRRHRSRRSPMTPPRAG